MRYQKPTIVELSARARSATGWPDGCYNGSTNADVCATGTDVTSGRDGCRAGSGAIMGVCTSGDNPGGTMPQCASGISGAADTCTAGSVAV